jgi:hypothetical protein
MKIADRKGFVLIVLLTLVLFASVSLASEKKPSGTVSIETTSVAIGIGFEWGEGVLKFQGKEYKFRIKGLSVVDVGVTKISATGNVYHLNRVSDFPGTFAAVEAGGALGAGAGAQAMENHYGVVMTLTSTKAGLKLKLAAEGIRVQMK